MAKYRVTFEPMGVTAEADPEKYPYGTHGKPGSLLDIALANKVDIEHACGGVGVCCTCHVIVTEGEQNLSEPEDAELDRIEMAPGNTVHSRLACQAVAEGDVTVRVPQWNRNLAKE